MASATQSAPLPSGSPSQSMGVPLMPKKASPRDKFYSQALGPSIHTHIKQARVLLVGAGGIGCELLKTLVLSGFGEVHIVDLDTIDLSNLNRQFLFRHEHIKKSKALVACDAAQRFNPSVRLVAHHANIKDMPPFDVSFFRGFQLVFNALDNLDARRHVNRMCMAADVPLIESGTTGFNGQVQVIRRGVTACYDCTPKETPRSFPVCTIRSTPSQPIHCIVWAKSYLLNEMFGDSEDESAFDHSTDAQNAAEIAELRKESEALKVLRQAIGTPAFARKLSDKVFCADIQRLCSMEDMWKTRTPPQPLAYDTVMVEAEHSGGLSDGSNAKASLLLDGQRVWTLAESLVVFNDSIERLSQRVIALRSGGGSAMIEFDKDDIDTLDFVAAAANIRSTLFGIERKSRFDIKQMAGNIIPAIATTNAIVAGLCVLQSFAILRGQYNTAKEVFLTPFAPDRLLASDNARTPNPECPVCSAFQVSVRVDLSSARLLDILEFIQEQLGFGAREIVINKDQDILYDVEETDNLAKKLVDLGIQHGSFLTVMDDEDEDPFVNVSISIEDSKDAHPDGKKVMAIGLDEDESPLALPRRPKKKKVPPPAEAPAPNPAPSTKNQGVAGDDDVVILEEAPPPPKRSRDSDGVSSGAGDEQRAAKKAKLGVLSEVTPGSSKTNSGTSAPSDNAIVIDD